MKGVIYYHDSRLFNMLQFLNFYPDFLALVCQKYQRFMGFDLISGWFEININYKWTKPQILLNQLLSVFNQFLKDKLRYFMLKIENLSS